MEGDNNFTTSSIDSILNSNSDIINANNYSNKTYDFTQPNKFVTHLSTNKSDK